VRFDIVWRDQAGTETILGTAMNTFGPSVSPTPIPSCNAVKFETDVAGIAADAAPGDQLILRFNTVGGASNAYYIPNGDGSATGGRYPSLTLP
jgi:hypothetical protein